MNVFQNINKTTILLLWASFIFSNAFGCDLCSCTTSNGSSGFGNLNMSSFIGLRYTNQSYESLDGIFSNSPKSEENFNTYQIWAKIPVCKSFYLSTIIPYQDFTRKFIDRTEHIEGLGDITVMGWYKINFYKKPKEEKGKFYNNQKERSGHSLNIGLGIKAPTGQFEEELTGSVNPGFQVGTGSWDFISTLVYSFFLKKIGFNASSAYYLKSKNKNEYQFGNQFSYNITSFYNQNLSIASKISPFIGISGDIYENIKQYNETIANTEGTIFNGSLGSEVSYRKFQLGAKFTFPIKQDLFNGNVESKNRLSLYLNYNL